MFRTLFKEGKSTASSGGGRLASPLVKRRLPHVASAAYMSSPQTVRKNSSRGFGRMKKKCSVPDGLGSRSPPPAPDCSLAFNAFCEDPKNLQISEHVSNKAWFHNIMLLYKELKQYDTRIEHCSNRVLPDATSGPLSYKPAFLIVSIRT